MSDTEQNQEENKQTEQNDDNAELGSESARDNKKKEFFKEELKRLQTALLEERDKIQEPTLKDHVPYTFNNLEPYYNCTTAKFLINIDEEEEDDVNTRPPPPDPNNPCYVSRKMALGICDPWVDHRMDIELEEKPTPRPPNTPRDGKKTEDKDKSRPPKEGSTALPKFPAVSMSRQGIKKDLKYSDVPELRDILKTKTGTDAQGRMDEDYNRTKQDYYRMQLDRTIDSPHMRATYFAYLQNTPGSKKAIYECVKTTEKAS